MFRAAFIGFCVLLFAAVCFSARVGAGPNDGDHSDGGSIAMRKAIFLCVISPLICIELCLCDRKHP